MVVALRPAIVYDLGSVRREKRYKERSVVGKPHGDKRKVGYERIIEYEDKRLRRKAMEYKDNKMKDESVGVNRGLE